MKSSLSLTFYTKGKNNNNWYCYYMYYNYNNRLTGTTKATGYGYDKMSTCVSNALNLFKDKFKRYSKNAKHYTSYGLLSDNSISYGIGLSSVLACIKCFKNVKVKNIYYGINENNIRLEILEDNNNAKK